MKKTALSFLFFGALLSSVAQNQRFSAGVKAGLSSSQVSGDNLAGFDKTGFNGGIFSSVLFTKKWSAQFELLFIQKGSKYAGQPDAADFEYYRLQLNYIEVPLFIQFHFKKFTFEAGPGYSYLINYKEEDETGDITGLRPFHNSEISYNLGVNYQIIQPLGINVRFSNSFSSIRDHSSGAHTLMNPGQQNTVLQLALSYTFGNAKQE